MIKKETNNHLLKKIDLGVVPFIFKFSAKIRKQRKKQGLVKLVCHSEYFMIVKFTYLPIFPKKEIKKGTTFVFFVCFRREIELEKKIKLTAYSVTLT